MKSAQSIQRFNLARGVDLCSFVQSSALVFSEERRNVNVLYVASGSLEVQTHSGLSMPAQSAQAIFIGPNQERVRLIPQSARVTLCLLSFNPLKLPPAFAQVIEVFDLNIYHLAKRFDTHSLEVVSSPSLAHIWGEVMPLMADAHRGYMRLKAIELLRVVDEVLDVHERSSALDAHTTHTPTTIAENPTDSTLAQPSGGLSALTKESSTAQETGKPLGRMNHAEVAYMAQRLLMKDVSTQLTIPELARMCGVSPTVLKASFKETFDVPIYQWFREYKIKSASREIAATTRPISAIAHEFGYTNPSKFTRAFVEVMGTTPREYRQQQARA